MTTPLFGEAFGGKSMGSRFRQANTLWRWWFQRFPSGTHRSPLLTLPQPQTGFTLLELLVVMVMVGVLAALAAPSWNNFVTGQRLGFAQDEVLRTLRRGQAQARQQRRVWEVCFRDRQGQIEFSIHPFGGVTGCGNARWQPLGAETDAKVAIDGANSTMFRRNGTYRVQFKLNGWTNGQLGRLTLVPRNLPNLGRDGDRRCVFISTLLGAMRMDRDQDCLR